MIRSFLVITLLMFSMALTAAEIKFLDNPTWTSVLAQAKKENKVIFLDAYATWCGPCKQMDADTYTNDAVAAFYNANFINVKYDMEKGEGVSLAGRYEINSYPNLVFINPDGLMVHRGVGFKPADDFLALGKIAVNPQTQYFTLKRKALALSNKDFLTFAKQAVALQDDDFGYISRDFLATKSDILGDSELIDLVMNYAFALPKEKDLLYFKDNKAKILQLGGYSESEVDERLISLTMQFALSDQVQTSDEIDFDAVKVVLDRFVPTRSFFVFQFFKTQYFLENKETEEALKAFDVILNNPEKVAYTELCNAMMGFGQTLHEIGKLEAYFTKFDKIEVQAKDANLIYLKDFVKAIVYIKTKQNSKFKETANLMLASNTTPQEVKRDLKLAMQNVEN